MSEILYKMKLFGYHKFEIKTSNSKSEVIDILKQNLKTEGPWSSLFNSIKESLKSSKPPDTIHPYYGNITQDGFLLKSSNPRQIPIYGKVKETPDGSKVTVVVKEQRHFVLGSAFLLFIAIPIIRLARTGSLSIPFYTLLFMFIVVRLFAYSCYRKDVSNIKKFLTRMLC
jgi:hypothetical protein